jgi:hypothetical protein
MSHTRSPECLCEGEFIWACGPECECYHHAMDTPCPECGSWDHDADIERWYQAFAEVTGTEAVTPEGKTAIFHRFMAEYARLRGGA